MLNKIKGVKIEQEDGTLSDTIPIGVEVENVGTPGGSLDKDLKTIKSDIEINKNGIKNLEGSVKGLASGSPLVANSIAEMTDETRVYVNTTDGHWYYYNGSSWADGGVYQAAENSEAVITIQNNLNNLYERKHGKNCFNKKALKIGYWHNNTEQRKEDMGYYKSDLLKPGKTYTVSGANAHVFFEYYNNNTRLGLDEILSGKTATVPLTTTYVYISSFLNFKQEEYTQIEEGEKTSYEPYYEYNDIKDYKRLDSLEEKIDYIIVSKDGTGDFTTLSEAVSYAKTGSTIYVKPRHLW